MNIQELEFKQLKKKKLLIDIISEILLIIGGIAAFGTYTSTAIQLLGAFLVLIGFILGVWSTIFQRSKKYKKLEAKEDEDDRSLHDMVDEYGLVMIIFGIVFVLSLFIGGFYFLFVLAHFNWMKALLFLTAFELVTDLRDYFNIDRE